MGDAKYQGLILAAGHGSRMGPFGEKVPKPIAPVCNRPLMTYQLELMKSLGIDDVTIVIGHLGHVITRIIGDGSQFGVRVRYHEQQERLGLAHAVGQVERHMDRPFMLLLGDIFFQVDRVERMISEFERHHPAAVLAVKEETDIEKVKKNFSVLLREDGTVRRVIEKPRHVTNMLKGCGLYFFDLPIFDAIRRTPRTAMRDEYELTDSIQILIDYEYGVRIAPVVEWDINLTFTKDLVDCCVFQLKKEGKPHLVGEHCSIAEGTELVDTVIGDNVTISRPVKLERCVVLSGTTLSNGQDYNDCIITPDAKLLTKHD